MQHNDYESTSLSRGTSPTDPKSDMPSSSKDNQGKERCSINDLKTARAPDWKQRIQAYWFEKGLADRPPFLQNIYLKIPRLVFVNTNLPEDYVDPATDRPLIHYPRNKIRSTKYTPLTFLPKNLLNQFKNVANIYFLILVILGAFQVFGVASPGLAAVPLIVIVCITAIKDAVEDYRRVISDAELNNCPIHLLQGMNNKNVILDDVGSWRRFKKGCTAATIKTYRALKAVSIRAFGSKQKKKAFNDEIALQERNDLYRVSTVHSEHSEISHLGRPSMATRRSRKSHQLQRPSAPTKPRPHSILNPVLFDENSTNPETVNTTFKNRKWKDVSIGDFIRVRANEEVPADMVLISTSDAEGNCFIETMNLDGETNLKTKTAVACGGSSALKHSKDLGNTKFWIECDPPNAQLYSFRGTLHYEDYDESGNLLNNDEKEAIKYNNVLLRGSILRNTKWVIGVVVYTGSETKIVMNGGITPVKKSRISNELNLSVVMNFLVLFILCLVSGIINGLFYRKLDESRLYFEFKPYSPTAAGNGVLSFFVVLIIYQSLVPISLYISIEIIKTLQAFFIYSDVKMYYEKLDFPCIPQAWNISDDLGQIEYIFSDKTGTLTQNVMDFKKCLIGGKSYGLAYTEAKQGMDRRLGIDVVLEIERWNAIIKKDKQTMIDKLKDLMNNDQFRDENLTFVSSEFVDDISHSSKANSEQKRANEEFMLALAVCHTVMTEKNEFDPSMNDLKAESPDEAALVSVARDVGFVFKSRTRNRLFLEVFGDPREFELLHTIGFTSSRKRMSCIVRSDTGRLFMVTKGADNVIFERLTRSNSSDEVLKRTALHLEDYAKEGLRTLCIASKDLDENEFKKWHARQREAESLIDDSRDAIIDALNEELENDLELLGGTGIEDRLQQGVPDSISLLSEAGIKLWVLTGDRIETAINIGFSCNLLRNDMKLLLVRHNESNPHDHNYISKLVVEYLQDHYDSRIMDEEGVNELIKIEKRNHALPEANKALIIEGAALLSIFDNQGDDELLQKQFLLLGKQCKAVICCRVSPAQKAQIVRVVKDNLDVMTLAIGDGANDVAMIQAAHVGVGIAGEEGRQAVMASDYGIGQFRFLSRLLLVHGRWSYKRLAEMIPCFFYKNVVFTFTCFWYGIYNDFDGSYLYEYTFLMFYNLAFTSLPVIFMGVLDQDVSDTVSLVVPELYRSGILSLEWSQYKFVWYMFDGLYQSVISFFFPYLIFYVSFQNHEGLPVDHRFWVGVLCCAVSVTACNIYVLLQQFRWDWLSLLIYALSTLVVFFWTGVWSARSYVGEFYKAGAQILGTLGFWCCYFVSVIICVLPRFTYDFLKKNFSPRDIDIIRELVRAGEYRDYPEGYDPTNTSDIERHRILQRLNEGDDELLAKVENAVETNHDDQRSTKSADQGKIVKAFKLIRKRGALIRSRRDTINDSSRYNLRLLNKPLDLSQLRLEMIQRGEYNTGERNSLDRISTTQGIPGLTQAETLMTYHTRQSINFGR